MKRFLIDLDGRLMLQASDLPSWFSGDDYKERAQQYAALKHGYAYGFIMDQKVHVTFASEAVAAPVVSTIVHLVERHADRAIELEVLHAGRPYVRALEAGASERVELLAELGRTPALLAA